MLEKEKELRGKEEPDQGRRGRASYEKELDWKKCLQKRSSGINQAGK